MKNKFKKSKIIVPALALITTTTVASVTGTVAWFTANRTATVTASTFKSTAQNSSLKVSTEALVGTSNATSTAATEASISIDGSLTHGSYNAQAITSSSQGELYVADFGGDDTVVTGYSSKGTLGYAKTNASGTTTEQHSTWAAEVSSDSDKKIWYAVAWKMTFKVEGTTSLSTTSSLFFDPTATKFTDSVDKGQTLQGLRIALMTSSKFTVVGGLEGASNEKHVKETWTKSASDSNASTHTASFATGIYHKYGEEVTKAVDASADTLQGHACYLGDIDATDGLEVTAVAWFEGEDNSIVKDKTMSNVTAALSFYSRNVVTSGN